MTEFLEMEEEDIINIFVYLLYFILTGTGWLVRILLLIGWMFFSFNYS
jgi:hypothetical protein